MGSNHGMRIQMTSLESPQKKECANAGYVGDNMSGARDVYSTSLKTEGVPLFMPPFAHCFFGEFPVTSFGRALHDWIPPNAP